MSQSQDWPELAKDYVLWQSQRGTDVEVMLQRTPTNTRTNEALARWTNALCNITHHWKGPYQDMFSDIPPLLEEAFLTMDGYSRKQAIELAAAMARGATPDQPGQPEKKRGGLLGIFGR
jgi:hypothetical protein